MLSRRLTTGIVFVILLLLSACATGSRLVILEDPTGTGFTMSFTRFSVTNKCTLSLVEGDVVQVEAVHESGKMGLRVSGMKGSEPYEGNDLKTLTFTIRVSETDDYAFWITGHDATGKITVKNLGHKITER
jgi:hypothetical protein